MATFFRRDDWVTDALGNAQSGVSVYVCSQPATTGSIPPSPLVQLYSDPAGANPITQPVITDGYGHAFYYTAPGTFTIVYFSPQISEVVLLDQIISGVVSQVTSSPLSGVQNGTNRVFTIPSVPTNFLTVYVNGIFQLLGTNYTVSGATITFTVAPQSTDQLWAVYQ